MRPLPNGTFLLRYQRNDGKQAELAKGRSSGVAFCKQLLPDASTEMESHSLDLMLMVVRGGPEHIETDDDLLSDSDYIFVLQAALGEFNRARTEATAPSAATRSTDDVRDEDRRRRVTAGTAATLVKS